MANREWTKDEIRALKARRHEPVKRLAKEFKRTEGAIRQKASSSGISLASKAKRKAA